ncbi:MAG: cysteine hydrolase family protein [Paracoccaceae bacterium]
MLGGKGLAWAAGTEIHPEIAGSVDHVVTKRVQDGFENPELGSLLDRLKIGRLQIAGLDICFCVKKTAVAAAARGYHVTLLTEAIRTARPKEWHRWRGALSHPSGPSRRSPRTRKRPSMRKPSGSPEIGGASSGAGR